MTLYLDYDGGQLVVSKNATSRLGTGRVHENDIGPIAIVILRGTGNEGDPFTVSALPDGFDTIAIGARDKDDLTGDMLFSVNVFVETGSGDDLSYVGVLDLTADAIHDLFPDDDLTKLVHNIVLDLELSASDGSRRETPASDWSFVITRDIYDSDGAVAPAVTALTTVPYCKHSITGLAGVGLFDATKLDSVYTADGAAPTNLTYILFIAGSGMQVWRLEASDATPADGVNVVDPLDFDLSTNNRKWYRRA